MCARETIGRPCLCGPVGAYPTLPSSAGRRIGGFRRSKGLQETARPGALGLDRGDFLTMLKKLGPIYGANWIGDGNREKFEV